jgi:hypothetical protein
MKASVWLLGLTMLVTATPTLAQTHATVGDAPEISRSAGVEGGVVVLWPRIVPKSEKEKTRKVAAVVQKQLEVLVRKFLPGRPVDVRPEPERTCRKAGCLAVSVGALLARKGKGCAVVALVSRPGKSAARLVSWVGKVKLKTDFAPFREPPESYLSITDFAVCDEVTSQLSRQAEPVTRVLRNLASP